MSLNITYHSTAGGDVPKYGGGGVIPVWPPQIGEEVIALTGDSTVQTETVIARLIPDEDCRVAVSDDASPATVTSFKISAGAVEAILIPISNTINVIAA